MYNVIPRRRNTKIIITIEYVTRFNIQCDHNLNIMSKEETYLKAIKPKAIKILNRKRI